MVVVVVGKHGMGSHSTFAPKDGVREEDLNALCIEHLTVSTEKSFNAMRFERPKDRRILQQLLPSTMYFKSPQMMNEALQLRLSSGDKEHFASAIS